MSLIDEYVAKCDEVIQRGGDYKGLSNEICSVFYNDIPKINHYKGAFVDGPITYTRDDIAKLRGKLIALKERRDHEVRLAQLASQSISVQAEASSEVHVSVSISQVFEAIDALDVLDDEKTRAKGLIADAQNERDAVKRGEKALRAAKWAVATGVEALKAISPILPQLLQTAC